MRFILDEHLPVSLAQALVRLGHDVVHVAEPPLRGAADRDIVEKAIETGAVIVSKDRDFLYGRRPGETYQVDWVRIGNAASDALVARCVAAWPGLLQALADGEQVVELR